MKPRVYVAIFLLMLPFQAALLGPLSISGIKPDLPLAILFVIGLLTSPIEATLAGIGIGLMQDIGSTSLIGFSGFTRGLTGLAAGILGMRVLDTGSPAIVVFLALFSFVEGVLIASFLQVTYGDVPFFSLVGTRFLPQALYTGILGLAVLRIVNKKGVIAMLKRRDLQKER